MNSLLKKKEVQVDRSVCTVVSSLPFRLREEKPGLFPIGLYCLPPVKERGDIEVLVVNEGLYYRYIGEGKQVEQYEKAVVIANSVVNDYANAQLGVDFTHEDVADNARPALFWVYGAWSKDEVKANFKTEIEIALKQQNKWFGNLVKIADDDWARYHQHKMISDLQRYAAGALGARKEWLSPEIQANTMDMCPACKSMIPAGAIICQVCRTLINPEAFSKLGLKQAV